VFKRKKEKGFIFSFTKDLTTGAAWLSSARAVKRFG